MKAELIITNISKIYTSSQKAPVRGEKMKDIRIFEHASIAIKNGKIIALGDIDFEHYQDAKTKIIDAKNNIMIPGFIDSHTHLVHAGSRVKETMMLIEGKSYLDILKEGGGILSTVKQTRESSFEDLYQKGAQDLTEMLSFGVTTVEAKSGYGLDFETEVKQLEVSKKLGEDQAIDIYNTYLGAHAIPKEFESNRKSYISMVKNNMIYIKNNHLADAVDVFMEQGVFDYEETKELLEEAKKLGFKIHLHADEMIPLGGTKLGIELGASSVDHLMAMSTEDMKLLKSTKTICNLLPSTSFFLNKDYAKARKMIESGACIAISSDYNPGSAPSKNFQFAMQLAFNKLKMHPYEILTAVTINPAYSLGIHEEVGTIDIGKQADLVLIDRENFESILMSVGSNYVSQVFKKGKLVYSK
ncbi:MAG: imidazolonepropionase [Candidatus Izemoplasmatales bacterium]